MAIVSANLLFVSRTSSITFLRHRTYTEEWEVVVDSVLDTEQTIALQQTAFGMPLRGQRFYRDPFCIASKIEYAQSEDTPLIWYVTYTYESNPDFPNATGPNGNVDPSTLPDNPLQKPAVWKISFQQTQKPGTRWYAVDGGGNVAGALSLLQNSAQLPFDPPVMIDVSYPLLRVTQNVAAVTFPYLLSLQDAVNSKAWKGFAPRQVRLTGVDAGNKIENGVAFVELTVDLMLKQETWDLQVLDYGSYQLNNRSNNVNPNGPPVPKWVVTRDPFGNVAPAPLNGNGKQLAPGADPVFLRGVPSNYQLVDFNTIFNF